MCCHSVFSWCAPWDGPFLITLLGIDRTSQRSLFSFRTLSEGRKHVPQVQKTIPFVQYVIQLGALYSWSDLANLEVLNVSHAGDHFLRLLAEWIERVILLQVGLQRFFIRMRLELMNQLLDCFFADVIMLLDGRMEQSLDPEVYFTATTFVVRSTATSFSVLARMVERRLRVRACSVLAVIIQVQV